MKIEGVKQYSECGSKQGTKMREFEWARKIEDDDGYEEGIPKENLFSVQPNQVHKLFITWCDKCGCSDHKTPQNRI